MAAASPEDPPKEDKCCTPAAVSAPSPTAVTKPSPTSSHDEIKAVARKFADSPIQNPDPGVWAILTAISKNARQRPQGMNIILNGDEHCIGRLAESRFQIGDIAISGMHCKIYRKMLASKDDEASSDSCPSAFLKDTSTNGTFHNWKKLRKSSPEAQLQHGDIISFIAPPHEDRAYAFVYREVRKSRGNITGVNLKRKSEDFGNESKRTKGIGIGAADGPVSLDDVRSLQRSNTELRKQLESHVTTIEVLRSENRESCARHENELKELKDSISNAYTNQIAELKDTIEVNLKELDEVKVTSSNLRNSIKDLNERLGASTQSRAEADDVIHSQKARISELELQLDEEKNQRKEEREKAATDLKSALQRVQAEAQEEINQQAEAFSKQNKKQEEVIGKLQDSEKESRTQVDTLRSKLEDTRESLVSSEKKVRELEKQVNEEQITSENNRKKAEDAVLELKRLRKDLEVEKVAREDAWAKVSALELEISAAMHELSIEKQRFQGARERIILRETQLRAFYSTTEEISALFAKQQEQLKAMQKTLEDEENYENLSLGFDPGPRPRENTTEIFGLKGEKSSCHNNQIKIQIAPGTSTANAAQMVNVSSSEDTSSTEKHDCGIGSHDDDTQDLECTSPSKSIKGFGSLIDGMGAPSLPCEELPDTERVAETESHGPDTALDGQGTSPRCNNLTGDTQLDGETQPQDNTEKPEGQEEKNDHLSQSRIEDTEMGTIRTADLLASEALASWANSTAPSFHGENESPRHVGSDPSHAALFVTDGQADESQTNVATSGIARLSDEHLALNAMIEIVAPEFKDQFRSEQDRENNEPMSDAETEEGSNQRGHSDDSGDDSSEHASRGDGSQRESGDDMIEDSVG